MNVLLVLVAYLIGSIPFGWLIARSRGVDLFRAGSGNIGATNVGRVLGRKFAILVFLLDFAKGALTVALINRVFQPALGWLVAVALAAFFGHLFPIYLRFRGGKGVATGAGVAIALTPFPGLLGLLTWLAVVSSSRIVSLASLLATTIMTIAHLLLTSGPWVGENACLSTFLVGGTGMVFLKHRANMLRLWRHRENQLSESATMQSVGRFLHLLALAMWLGGSVFFNFIAAPSLFATFKEVVANNPSDRTANIALAPGIDETQQAQLASALAGAAVGPIFPVYFTLVAVCITVALATSFGWWYSGTGRRVEVWRVRIMLISAIIIAISIPLSNLVTELRVARLSPDPIVADAAREAFGAWHLVSLLLSFVLTLLAIGGVWLAAKLPYSAGATTQTDSAAG